MDDLPSLKEAASMIREKGLDATCRDYLIFMAIFFTLFFTIYLEIGASQRFFTAYK